MSNTLRDAPGARFDYNELHLQLAGCMAVAATGETMVRLAAKHVFEPCGMRSTAFSNNANPALGAGLRSSHVDYLLFLEKYFRGELLPPGLMAEMERDQYPRAHRAAADEGWHYGLTSWIECPAGVHEWGEACIELGLHSSGGTAGFRPQVNRKRGYYIQIGAFLLPGIGAPITLALSRRLQPLLAEIFPAGTHGAR